MVTKSPVGAPAKLQKRDVSFRYTKPIKSQDSADLYGSGDPHPIRELEAFMRAVHVLVLGGLVAFLSACNNGGNLTLEPGAVISKRKGSPFVQVNQGGKALIIEQGKTANTGVHGWVAVQNVASKNLNDGSGNKIIMNKTSAVGQ